MRSNRIVFATCLCLALSVIDAKADLVISWGGDYVTGNEDLQAKDGTTETGLDLDGDAQFDDGRRGRLLSFTQSMNPQSGYSGTSDIFYGGASKGRLNNSNPGNWNRFRISDSGVDDEMDIRVGGGGNRDFQYLQLWQQTDFLTLQTGNLGFTSSSNLSITFGGTLQGITEARWLVREGSTLYLSEATIDTSATGATRTLAFGTDSNDGNWAAYSPSTTTLDLNFDQTTSFAPQDFGNVTAVGFYFEKDAFSGTEGRWSITAFDADLTLVPEPPASTFLVAMGLVAVWRRVEV